jgi:hypothetical protein
MRFIGLGLLVAPFVISALQAAPALDEKPTGTPPRLLPAPQVEDNGGLTFRRVRTEYRNETRSRVVIDPQTGKKIQITEAVIVPVAVETIQKLDAKEYSAYDLDGKKIEDKDMAEAIKKHPLIVVSGDGKKVDAGYLKMFREGTVVLVPTPEAISKMDGNNQPDKTVPPGPRGLLPDESPPPKK